MPTFPYEFNDMSRRPARTVALATHASELPYLFDLPNASFQVALNADQHQLAASTARRMGAWFAATGDPSTLATGSPSFRRRGKVCPWSRLSHGPTVGSPRAITAFWAAS